MRQEGELGDDQEVGWVVVWEVVCGGLEGALTFQILNNVQKLLYVSLYMMMQLC